MPADRVVDQINDNRKINVLGPRHDKDMIEAVIIASVDDFNEAVVDRMAFEIRRGN